MKQLHAIYAFLCLGTLLTAVSCTDTVTDEPFTGTRAIAFTPAAETRAAVDKTANLQDFSVWGGYDNNATNVFDGVTVQVPNWTYSGGTQYWIEEKDYQFYAVHPATLPSDTKADVATNGSITVTGFDCSATGSGAVDLMIATAQGNGSNPVPVALSFGHELSRVKFSIQTEATVILSNISLTGIAYKGTFSKEPNASGTWTDLTIADETDTPFKTVDGGTLTESTGSIDLLGGDLLLIPQTLTETSVFTMTWTYEDGTKKTVDVPLPKAGQPEWKRGISYHYSAVIPEQSSDIKLTVSVGDWNDKKVNVDLQ